jgi:hypothetical protein
MGTVLLISLLVAGDPEPGKVVAFHDRVLQIPVKFDPARRAQISQVILFQSTNQGRTWEQKAAIPATQEYINVSFDTDGSYWFTLCIVGQDGKREPSDPSRAPVGLKLLVDTKRPEIHLNAMRQGEGITVEWTIQEENPQLATLKLEYRTADMPAGQWLPVDIKKQLSDRVGFVVNGRAAVTVRLEMKDEANNVGSSQVEVPALPPPSGVPFPTTQLVAAPQTDGGSGSPFAAQNAGMVRNQSRSLEGPLDPPPALGGAASPPPPGGSGQGGVLASTGPQSPSLGPPPSGPPAGSSPPRSQLPKMEYVNTNHITLDYEVDKIGASGIGGVELYVTRDDGNTWQMLTRENLDGRASPEPAPGASPLKRSITAELPGEGRYGLYLVVRNGVGVGRQAPRNGDRPQMRVEVDLTPPEGTLYGLQLAPGQRDSVIVSWSAKDANLTDKPIRLEWAERKNGPWEPIGEGDLPNTGRFVWKLPAKIPGRVYLKMTITDLAGNTGVAESADQVTIDLNEPEVKSLSISHGSRQP